MATSSSLCLLILITNLSLFLSSTTNTATATDYDLCSPFLCGNITFLFPFTSSDTFGSNPKDCGLPGYQIACDKSEPSSPSASIFFSGRPYSVKNLYTEERLITIVDSTLINDLKTNSCISLRNLPRVSNTSDYSLKLPPWNISLSLFKCPVEITLSDEFLDEVVSNFTCSEGNNKVYVSSGSGFNSPSRTSPVLTPNRCELIRVPVSSASYEFLSGNKLGITLVDVLADGFPLMWPSFEACDSCNLTGGRCGFDGGLRRIVCIQEEKKLKQRKKWKLFVGVAAGLSVMLIIVLAFRKRIAATLKKTDKNQNAGQEINAESFIRTYRSELLTNYTYSDIKNMTNGFKEKLGGGGFGNVYKGKLPDGRLVAVKLLEKSSKNGDGQDFVTEVATIGRIHHINVIKLLGFSCSGPRQALIYEYMPNGSLGDLLSNKEFCVSLGLARMLEIAIGIAHGIEYLHNGCESRILHLDIKPQNVLLDHHLNPKISDFGLAKVFSRSQSVVQMTTVKGTIGYIAPEIFMRNFGNVSHKSDVYSFGMLLLEMIGGRINVNHVEPNISTSSEVYFPNNIYKLIEEKILDGFEIIPEQEDANIEKKIILVSLWCIQTNPRDRPSMTRVLEMLIRDVDAIEMPPNPSLFSLPRVEYEIDIASIDERNIE
ncbi:hypothetical protein JCGZ_18364 [Jatropha curcas]|uniref:non-specific serine/threonine protein kinase n=1 Tax=Jatropha curcas TaxID=180498 RepID=A0A067K316_JATCU|nr:rust resistance kinase Lr10 [Jatropha curcas]KDP29443.1 hypothetical protein JCGZ_18364 [Jatropha curcas]